MKDDSVYYIITCEPTYPYILAYSFLDEMIKEFSLLYTPSVVKSVKRPFAFLEFGKISGYDSLLILIFLIWITDSYLNKIQQKYNSSRSLAARINLPDMTNDFNLYPPTYMNVSDLEPPKPPTMKNGLNSNSNHSVISVSNSNGSISMQESHVTGILFEIYLESL